MIVRMLNVPNVITLVRLGLVPVMAYYLADEAYEIALPIFLVAALFIEFTVLLLVMAAAAGWIKTGAWMPTAFVVVFMTVVASGVQYVWVWGRKAISGSRTHQDA